MGGSAHAHVRGSTNEFYDWLESIGGHAPPAGPVGPGLGWGPKVSAGHDNGLITIALEEADDAKRERRRTQMGEPYRSLHGHFRHDVGRYFWKCWSATVAAWTSAALFSAMTTGTTVRRCRRIIKMARRRTGGSTLSAPVQPLIPDNQDLDPFVLPSPAIAKLTFVARGRAFNAQMAMLEQTPKRLNLLLHRRGAV